MNTLEKYLLEELKQSDRKLMKLNDSQSSLIKFYFTTVFSLATIGAALYNYGILKKENILIPYIVLLPLFLFGLVVYNSLKKALIEYEYLEHKRNQIGEYFVYGALKREYRVFGSPFKPFYTFISWIIVANIFAFIYTAFPFFRGRSVQTFILITIPAFLTLIMTSIVIVSLNTARKKARDTKRIGDIRMLQLALEMYYDDNGKYPITDDFNNLSTHLSPSYMSEIPVDPLNKDNFKYQYEGKDGKEYLIKYFLEDGGEKAVRPHDEGRGKSIKT